MITNFESAKELITCKLCNAKMNEENLKDKPHRIMDNQELAIVYSLVLDDEASMAIPIQNDLLKTWGSSESELYDIATKNTFERFPFKFMSMSEMFSIDDELGFELPMYILTNSNNLNGAISMINPEAMKRIEEVFGKDFYVIPSSIHECIIVPKNMFSSYEDVEQMIRDVNKNNVDPREVLSNRALEIDVETGKLLCCDRNVSVETKKEISKNPVPDKDKTVRKDLESTPKL